LVEFEGHIFQQTIDIINGNRLCSTIANLFHYFYEAEFMHKLIKAFILTFGHIDDVLWLNNPNFADMIPLIYPKETKETASSASIINFLPATITKLKTSLLPL
jgi:hypothetical protein